MVSGLRTVASIYIHATVPISRRTINHIKRQPSYYCWWLFLEKNIVGDWWATTVRKESKEDRTEAITVFRSTCLLPARIKKSEEYILLLKGLRLTVIKLQINLKLGCSQKKQYWPRETPPFWKNKKQYYFLKNHSIAHHTQLQMTIFS